MACISFGQRQYDANTAWLSHARLYVTVSVPIRINLRSNKNNKPLQHACRRLHARTVCVTLKCNTLALSRTQKRVEIPIFILTIRIGRKLSNCLYTQTIKSYIYTAHVPKPQIRVGSEYLLTPNKQACALNYVGPN